MLIDVMRSAEAEDLLHFCLEDGEVIYGTHFKQELRNEKIMFVDAWDVLRKGRIYSQPEQDIKTGEWKYRVEGYEPDGKWMAIILTFKTMERVFLITIFSVKSKSKS